MRSSADPIPAVTESEASGEVHDIYQDIKVVTGVDVVNLVWRRLAVTSGALPAVWSMARPVYVSGRIAAEAQALRRELRPPALGLLPKAALTAAGVDHLGQLMIRAILDSYNRTNAMNLIALSAVRARMRPAEAGAKVSLAPAPMIMAAAEPSLPPLPPLPAMAALDPHVRELVELLNGFCEQDGRIIASMYRHLAYWPGYLALAWTLLAPPVQDGRMQAAIDEVRRQAAARAHGVAGDLTPLAVHLAPGVVDDIDEVLSLFTQHPIAKMAAICGALSCASPDP